MVSQCTAGRLPTHEQPAAHDARSTSLRRLARCHDAMASAGDALSRGLGLSPPPPQVGAMRPVGLTLPAGPIISGVLGTTSLGGTSIAAVVIGTLAWRGVISSAQCAVPTLTLNSYLAGFGGVGGTAYLFNSAVKDLFGRKRFAGSACLLSFLTTVSTTACGLATLVPNSLYTPKTCGLHNLIGVLAPAALGMLATLINASRPPRA